MTAGEPLLVVVGPTGVGKTAAVLELAEHLDLEAVSADSRQIYRGMDIGTGKPTPSERRRVVHHLVDIADPSDRYHAARFRLDALEAIAAIRARGRLPVVVGGTGLYVRALTKGLAPAPPGDPAFRAVLETELARHGPEWLHARLRAVDAAAAARLHPRDRVRVVRALEVRRAGAVAGAHPGGGEWKEASPFRLLMVGLGQARDRLNERLRARVRAMLARGMMDEVRALLDAGHDERAPGLVSIGYRELAAVICGRLDLEEAVRLMIRDTARYAKRQVTWFARDVEVRWIDVDEAKGPPGVAAQIARWSKEELIG